MVLRVIMFLFIGANNVLQIFDFSIHMFESQPLSCDVRSCSPFWFRRVSFGTFVFFFVCFREWIFLTF